LGLEILLQEKTAKVARVATHPSKVANRKTNKCVSGLERIAVIFNLTMLKRGARVGRWIEQQTVIARNPKFAKSAGEHSDAGVFLPVEEDAGWNSEGRTVGIAGANLAWDELVVDGETSAISGVMASVAGKEVL